MTGRYYERHANGKIKLIYLPFDILTNEIALSILSDEELGELFRAAHLYEKSGGETIPQLKSETAQKILAKYIAYFESSRNDMQKNSDKGTRMREARAEKEKTRMKEL